MPALSSVSAEKIVVVGFGHAGLSAAKALRRGGFDGKITIVGEEPIGGYERPALSKQLLELSATPVPNWLMTDAALIELGIDRIVDTRIVAIDRLRRVVSSADGRTFRYDRLILATGARPALPACAGAADVPYLTLRTFDDAIAVRSKLCHVSRLAIIGGGWIGLETAAAARQRGIGVVLIEAGQLLCGRLGAPFLSHYLDRLHRDAGVEIKYGVTTTELCKLEAGVRLRLSDYSSVEADAVVFGIGSTPNDELARQCGLSTDRGIATDCAGRTADPSIFACGDVARFRHPRQAEAGRIESWAHAEIQGELCAKAILGEKADYEQAPWFWSDQWDCNIQVVGHWPSGCEEVRRGGGSPAAFTLFFCIDDRVTGAIGINASRTIKQAKRLIERDIAIGPDELRDPAFNLNDALKRPRGVRRATELTK